MMNTVTCPYCFRDFDVENFVTTSAMSTYRECDHCGHDVNVLANLSKKQKTPVTEWQPIDTLPKDQLAILYYRDEMDDEPMVSFHDSRDPSMDVVSSRDTHWFPLPDFPDSRERWINEVEHWLNQDTGNRTKVLYVRSEGESDELGTMYSHHYTVNTRVEINRDRSIHLLK